MANNSRKMEILSFNTQTQSTLSSSQALSFRERPDASTFRETSKSRPCMLPPQVTARSETSRIDRLCLSGE